MRINDRVVCVDDDFSKCHADPKKYWKNLPIKGQIYVINNVITTKSGEVGLQLVGIYSFSGRTTLRPQRFRLFQSQNVDADCQSFHEIT